MIHKVEFLLPGSFLPESVVRTLDERSVDAATTQVPAGAFCFVLFDVPETPDLGPDFVVTAKRQNVSGRYYLGGDVLTLAEVEALGPEKRILASNMRGNGWARVIKTRRGNWQPFTDEDALLS